MYRDPVGHRIKTLNNLIKRSIDKVLGGRPDHATMMHMWIIGFVQERQEQGIDTFQKDIENEFSINRSTTSEMLKLMCKKGMIERVPVDYDARLKKIILTKQSCDFNKQLDQTMKDIHQKLVIGLTEEEIQTFIKITDKIIENVKQ